MEKRKYNAIQKSRGSLRTLRFEDAPLMLEWMHDESVVKNLQGNFLEKTIDDCKEFIEHSIKNKENLHLAITDDSDIYMGTVSLKHINRDSLTAEFAIVIRKSAMGKGYSAYAMAEIIRIGFEKIGLSKIYWCVDPVNKRAARFYDKNGYLKVTPNQIPAELVDNYSPAQILSYLWYQKSRSSESALNYGKRKVENDEPTDSKYNYSNL